LRIDEPDVSDSKREVIVDLLLHARGRVLRRQDLDSEEGRLRQDPAARLVSRNRDVGHTVALGRDLEAERGKHVNSQLAASAPQPTEQ
jgi:hypothetical protein